VIGIHDLPAVNATLNGTAAVLLGSGYYSIRTGRIETHRKIMLTAFAVSSVFLVCYLVYHWGIGGSMPYRHTGTLRFIYLTILSTHTVLAATVPVLAIITLRRGLLKRFSSHRRIARWTFPIGMYVSVTGVVVYVMLYQF
jgi:protein SCO1/2/putative membrane protein